MDNNGFLGECYCNICGARLQGIDEGRPAESYAGTYTGLCYTCERGPAYKLGTYFDTAEQWSFPPACPSYRRDRETHIGYPDCTCDHGSKWLSRADSQGGSYQTYCLACHERFYLNSVRLSAKQIEKAVTKWAVSLESKLRKIKDPTKQQAFYELYKAKYARRIHLYGRWCRRLNRMYGYVFAYKPHIARPIRKERKQERQPPP